MGFFSDIFKGSGSAKAARRGGAQQERAAQAGQDIVGGQFQDTQALLSPFIGAGQQLAGDLASASTLRGLPAVGVAQPGQVAGIPDPNVPQGVGAAVDLDDTRPATPAEISQLYRQILGREADPEGLNFAIREGLTAAEFARNTRGGQEFAQRFQDGSLPRSELGLPPEDGGQGLVAPGAPQERRGGFVDRIADISDSGVLAPIINERLGAVQNQLSQGGLRRSGRALTEAARVPTEAIFGLENQLFDRMQNTVRGAQAGAQTLGALGGNAAGTLATLEQARGNARAGSLIGQANARAAGNQNILNLASNVLQAPTSSGASVGTKLADSFFSDPKLKTNRVKVGEVGNLTVYGWDWADHAPDFVKDQPTTGFMADEVAEKYPEMVDDVVGFLTVNYPKLLERIA